MQTYAQHLADDVLGDARVISYTAIEEIPHKQSALLFLLPGGADVDPQMYGAERDKSVVYIDKKQDDMVWYLLNTYKSSRFFGICKGAQQLSAWHGGILVQDIATVYDDVLGDIHLGAHDIVTRDGQVIPTVGNHHQAMDLFVGDVLATDMSRLIPEVVRFSDKHIGVQFHPEWASIHHQSVHYTDKLIKEMFK
jgi:gamma-glutamyl-gamma-aminobutyrate hydrolase PuuD